jgi:ribosomal protein S11
MRGVIHIKKNAVNHFVIISESSGKVVLATSLNALRLSKSVLIKAGERLLYSKIIKKFLSFGFTQVFLKLEGTYTKEDTLAILNYFKYGLRTGEVSFLGICFVEKLPHNGCRRSKKKL